jgi:hypothetical protein
MTASSGSDWSSYNGVTWRLTGSHYSHVSGGASSLSGKYLFRDSIPSWAIGLDVTSTAVMRQLLASGGPRSLTRMLEQRDGDDFLSEGSVGRALGGLGVMANDGACTGSQAVRSQELPERVDAADAAEARVTDGAAAALRAPPPSAAPPPRPLREVELGSMPVPPQVEAAVAEPVARGTMMGRARGDSLVDERDVVFAAMSGPAAAPAEATNLPITEFIPHRLSGLFSGPEASQRLEA